MAVILPTFVHDIYYRDIPFTPFQIKQYLQKPLPELPKPEVLELHPCLSAYDNLQKKSMLAFVMLLEKYKLKEDQQLIRTSYPGRELSDLVFQHTQVLGDILHQALNESRIKLQEEL